MNSTSGISPVGLAPPQGLSGLIPLVERIDRVRDVILDCDPSRDWESIRIVVDRELRAISLELAARCDPVAIG